jgi:hypothetical protein
MTASLENLTPEQLEGLTRSKALLDSVLNDPETRKPALRLLKKKNPTLSIPEIDAEEAAAAAIEKERSERQALEAKIREAEARENVRAQREKVVAEGYCSLDEIPALEKFMLDNEIPNYEKAAKLFKQAKRAESAAAAAHVSGDNTLSMPNDKELYRNPTRWARQQAALEIDRIIGARQA